MVSSPPHPNHHYLVPKAKRVELLSRRRQTTVSAQQSNMYGLLPCVCYIFLVCYKHNNLPLNDYNNLSRRVGRRCERHLDSMKTTTWRVWQKQQKRRNRTTTLKLRWNLTSIRTIYFTQDWCQYIGRKRVWNIKGISNFDSVQRPPLLIEPLFCIEL